MERPEPRKKFSSSDHSSSSSLDGLDDLMANLRSGSNQVHNIFSVALCLQWIFICDTNQKLKFYNFLAKSLKFWFIRRAPSVTRCQSSWKMCSGSLWYSWRRCLSPWTSSGIVFLCVIWSIFRLLWLSIFNHYKYHILLTVSNGCWLWCKQGCKFLLWKKKRGRFIRRIFNIEVKNLMKCIVSVMWSSQQYFIPFKNAFLSCTLHFTLILILTNFKVDHLVHILQMWAFLKTHFMKMQNTHIEWEPSHFVSIFCS